MPQPPIGQKIEIKYAKDPLWKLAIIEAEDGPDHYLMAKQYNRDHDWWDTPHRCHKNHIKDWRYPVLN